jgi:lysyl-tRNA synthetase class I
VIAIGRKLWMFLRGIFDYSTRRETIHLRIEHDHKGTKMKLTVWFRRLYVSLGGRLSGPSLLSFMSLSIMLSMSSILYSFR